jgi:hypothetical protein
VTDFSGLTKTQVDWLCEVAFGGRTGMINPRTAKVLVDRGLIERVERQVGRDRFGPITVFDYVMPLGVHIDFCEWCSEVDRVTG